MEISPHATLEAIVRFPADPLSSSEAASCLGCHPSCIVDAVRLGKIEATRQNLRTRGNVRRIRVTKAALISYLWASESGQRETLRAAMQQLCPSLLKTLEAREKPAPARPRNVLPFEHPDLFDMTPATKASA